MDYRVRELGDALLEPWSVLIAWAGASKAQIATARCQFDAAEAPRSSGCGSRGP